MGRDGATATGGELHGLHHRWGRGLVDVCKAGRIVRLRYQPSPHAMRLLACLTTLVALTACSVAGRGSTAPTRTIPLPALPRVTRVVLTDAASGTPIGAVERADSVAALAAFYTRLGDGWADGAAPSPEIGATFYHDSVPVAYLALASGAFEARVRGRVLRRRAGADEALAFARLAGVPVEHGSGAAVGGLP